MSYIETIVEGQQFTARWSTGGPVLTWRITSRPMWSKTGKRFVWCEVVRPMVGHRAPAHAIPWHIEDLPGGIGTDLRVFYELNPHLPLDGHP